jgi:hypothetical protein
MKIVTLAAATLAASAFWTTAPVQAQEPTHGIPMVRCNTSFLSMTPELTCMASRGVINDNRIGGKEYHVSGLLNDRAIFMVLVQPPFTNSIRPYSEQTSASVLKSFNSVTRGAKDWSAITTDGNTSYMSFKTDKQDCIAFDHAGPLKDGGYAWVLRGYLCGGAGAPRVTYDVVKTHLAATRVGTVRESLNAYGQPIRPVPRG